ncbi:MAG: diguanylate cyclase [Rhodospirillales bacterium]|nr:diguanylate cyclase [Rhodospirillales bacterium]
MMQRLLLLLWCALTWALLGAGPAAGGDPPRPVAGNLDLSSWDFNRGGVKLAGEWRFLWNQLAQPAELAKTPADGAFSTLPRPWNEEAAGIRGFGYATFVLQVRVPAGAPPLALWIPYLNSAYRLWVNGQPAAAVGKVGTSAADETPRTLPAVAMIPEGATDVELVLQVSNHQHSEGGPNHALLLAARDDIQFRHGFTLGLDALIFGGALMFGLYYLAMFAGRPQESGYALFAAMSAVAALRAVSLHNLPNFLWPELPESLFLAGEYVAMFLFLPLYVLFLNSLFPHEISKRVGMLLLGLAVALCVTVLVAEPAFYTRLRDPYLVVLIAATLYCAGGVAVAAWRRRETADLLAATTLIFGTTAINDSLHYMQAIDTADLTPLGFVVFLFGHAVVLGTRTNHAVAEVERMSSERAALNADLSRKVEQRTEALQRSVDQLHRLATIDDLTGLNNRRHMLGLVSAEFERTARYDRPLVLLSIDVDHFKRVNDTFGHAVGDKVLIHLGAMLRNRLRATDAAGRVGGEEFLVLLPETNLDEGLRVAEDLRRQCEEAHLEADGTAVRFTISIGVAPVAGTRPDLAEALKRADDALYAAKAAGRNRIAVGAVAPAEPAPAAPPASGAA